MPEQLHIQKTQRDFLERVRVGAGRETQQEAFDLVFAFAEDRSADSVAAFADHFFADVLGKDE